MAKKRIVIPRRFVRIDSSKGTVAVRGRRGRFKGRTKVKKGRGDGTRVYRVKKDIDVDKDGKVDYFGGTILGRTRKPTRRKSSSKRTVKVRASKRARAYERTL